MSVNCSVWAWAQAIKVSGEKLVLLSLADHAGRDGICWPGQMRLAQLCNMSDRQVRDHLQALAEKGLLSKAKRVVNTGHPPVNVYQLHIEKWDAIVPGIVDGFSNDRNHTSGEGNRKHTSGETGSTLPTNRKEPSEKKTPQKKTSRKNAANTITKKWPAKASLPAYVAILRQLPVVESAPVSAEWIEEVRANAEEKTGQSDLEVGLTELAEKFRDWYSTPGQRNLKVWKTAWRRWVEEGYMKTAELSAGGPKHDPFDSNCICRMCKRNRGADEETESTEAVNPTEGPRRSSVGSGGDGKQTGTAAAAAAGEDQQGARKTTSDISKVSA